MDMNHLQAHSPSDPIPFSAQREQVISSFAKNNYDKYEEEKNVNELSEYIDENFELDETDEFMGLQKANCHLLRPNQNDIRQIDQKCTDYLGLLA